MRQLWYDFVGNSRDHTTYTFTLTRLLRATRLLLTELVTSGDQQERKQVPDGEHMFSECVYWYIYALFVDSVKLSQYSD
jgi:hypothetical protein